MSKADEIKVIDLLNKIANGENLPKKILYFDKVFYLIKTEDDFYTYSMRKNEKDWESWIDNKTNLIYNINETVLILDDDFELIEDQTIDIEECNINITCQELDHNLRDMQSYINNVIVEELKHLNKEIQSIKEE